jgi:putative nucleotidyltransferase with HDIG domain
MSTEGTRQPARDHSITLMHVFLLASGAILLAAAITLSLVLGSAVRKQAISDLRADLSHATGVVLTSKEADSLLVDRASVNAVTHRLLLDSNVATVEVVRTGQTPSLKERPGQIVYQQPLRSSGGRQGFIRVLSNPIDTGRNIDSRVRFIWLSVTLVFLALFVVLALLVRSASRSLQRRRTALQRQSQALLDAYRRLEQSSLEAIESLNATVDAKDPSTAGHSQRVVEIALRIGRELGFEPARLELLRLGALFHDIGKLAVPDAILLKPGRLTRQEFEVMKRHCDDGARIVDRFGPLRPVVSIIRHHHERWSGHGYPAGLEGETIPLEASIVGVADAWDAMTTNRPYKTMLSVEEAREEVDGCSGTQFRPDVVEALLSALEKDPEIFTPLGTPAPEAPKKSGRARARLQTIESIGFSET